MKKDNSSGHMKRNIALVILLAVLCIGGVELAACSYFAPETYEQIVSPVRYAASVTLDACRAGLNAAGRFCQAAAAQTVRLAGQAAHQAAAFWEDLTRGPEDTALTPEDSPPLPSSQTVPPAAGDPYLTEVLEVDGRKVLTGGTVDVVYFCQADEEWASQPYGTDTIGPYGCGPTAMAMAVASMTDTETDPAVMAAWAVEHGYWARRSGSYHSIVRGTAQAFGLKAEPFAGRTPEDLYQALDSGRLLVALMGPGHFTNGGHFIVLRGTTLGGDLLVADPNSLERSLQLWDPQIVLDELSSARDSGAPLWLLSPPDT